MSDYAELARPVGDALRALRPLVLEAFARPPEVEQRKEDGSSITALDFALEECLAEALLAIEVTFGLRSEEAGWMRQGSPTWHLDPLDGTANFERRLPLFASQVVLMDGAKPLFGAIYDPLADDLSWAAAGAGAWRQGRRLEMPDRSLAESRVVLDLAEDGIFMDDPDLVRRVRSSCYRVRALGSAAIHFREIASGVLDAYIGGRASPTPLHDLGPGLLLIREAHGKDSDGAGGDPLVSRCVVVAGIPGVHDGLVALLGRAG